MSNRFTDKLVFGESDGRGGFRAKTRQEQMMIEAQAAHEHMQKNFPKLLELRRIAVDNISLMLGLNEEQKFIIANKRDSMYEQSVFQQDCQLMNEMYQVDAKEALAVPTAQELLKFRCTLIDEVSEVDEIIKRCHEYETYPEKNAPEAVDLKVEILVAFVDWIVDIQVFAMSQCLRYGINPVPSMQIVMDSNFTKLGEDGKPIFDENKKFLKGPNYKKPEPAIREMIVDGLKQLQQLTKE